MDRDPFEESRDAVFDRHPIAHSHAPFDVGVVAHVAVGADHRAGQHVGERPHPGARPDLLTFAEGGGVDEDVARGHRRMPAERLGDPLLL